MQSKKIAVFTIGPYAVSAAIISDEERPKVVWSKKSEFRLPTQGESKQFYSVIQRKLAELVQALHQHQRDRTLDLHQLHCLFADPWPTDGVATAGITSDKPTSLTKDRLREVVTKAHNKFDKRRGQQAGLSHLGHRIVGVAANGEPIAFPYKDSAQEFSVRVHVSKLPDKLKKGVKRVFQKHFHPSTTQFHSLTDVVNRLWEQEHSLSSDFAIMMTGPNHVRTSMMENGRLYSIDRATVGENFLTEVLSQALNRPISDIRSRLSLESKGRQHKSASKAIRIALDEAGDYLDQTFRNQLSGSAQKTKHVYLITTDRIEGEIFQNLARQSARMHNSHIHTITDKSFAGRLQNQSLVDYDQILSILGVTKYLK